MYKLEYVCHRCGIHFSHDTLRAYDSWNQAEAAISSPHTYPSRSIYHHCDDEEGMGFADLVGFCRAGVIDNHGKEFLYAVAERDGIPGSKSYRMHDGPTPDLQNLMDHGISGSNNNFRILEMDKNGNNDLMIEIYHWDHYYGQWRQC